jgi:hypothetical protein
MHWCRLVVWAALGSLIPLTAAAQTKETASILGEEHELTTPVGWKMYTGQDGVGWNPPPEKLHGTFSCAVIGAPMPSGVGSAAALVKLLAEDEIAKRKAWAKILSQGEMQFVGLAGASAILGGTNPEGKGAATLYVAAQRGDRVYVFTADGLYDDLKDLGADLDTILNGVRPLGKASSTPAPVAGGSFGGTGQGEGATSPAILSDPFWGLSIKWLDAGWRLRIADGSYVLLHDSPQALVTISRVVTPGRKLREAKELKGARPTTFAGAEALVVDGTRDGAPERSFWILRSEDAFVVRFASVSFAEAEARHLESIDGGIRIHPSTLVQAAGGGFSVDLPFGVSLDRAPAPWKLLAARSGAGLLTVLEPKAKVELVLRVDRAQAGGDDPFYVDQRQFQTTCQLRRGTFDEHTVPIAGATEAHIYRCNNGRTDKGQRSAALMLRATAPSGNQTVHVLALGYYLGAKGVTPDREIAYFVQSLRLGGK